MRERLKPLIKTESQFLFMCHLVGPFLQRFQTERTRCLLDVSVSTPERETCMCMELTESNSCGQLSNDVAAALQRNGKIRCMRPHFSQ